jgi:hypothetical protein
MGGSQFAGNLRPFASRICVHHLRTSIAGSMCDPGRKKRPSHPKNCWCGRWCHTTPLTNSSLSHTPCRHPYPHLLSIPAVEGSRTLGIVRAGGHVRGRPLKNRPLYRDARADAGIMKRHLINQGRQECAGSIGGKYPAQRCPRFSGQRALDCD